MKWEERFASYAARTALNNGGCLLKGKNGCALCDRVGETVIVKELLCPSEEEAAYCTAVSQRLGISQMLVSRPVVPGDEKSGFGLWYPLAQEGKDLYNQIHDPYMGLALD